MTEPRRLEGDEVFERLERATPAEPVALGRYDVTARLGRGGMGTVYAAVDRERGARVALKTLKAPDASSAAQIKREFRTVADVSHEHLAPVYELACEDGLWFFAMELVDGVDLRRWARGANVETKTSTHVRRTTPMQPEMTTRKERDGDRDETGPPEPAGSVRQPASPPDRSASELRAAFADLVSGLGALHDAGLWHGDVKPGNVLVRKDGRVVLVDFGLARPVDEPKKKRGATSGTPTYMSPEQLAGLDVGPPSDWYAVGTMLYEMLTGRLPFGGGSHVELYIKKTSQLPPAPHELLPEVPLDLSELAMRLLRPDPSLRPSRSELAALLGGDADGAGPASEAAPRAMFVGREGELHRLDRAYERARGGTSVVVHVHGASGIGKTAMVRSFLGGVRDVDGAEVFRGRCYERESVPYKAFDGIVDELAARLVDAGLATDAALPAFAPELAQAFPALLAVPALAARARAAFAHDAKELRRRAWIALAELFAFVARARTVVLSIDDLQWADADSAALLESLVKDARDVPLLVVASFRSAEARANPALAAYLERAEALAASERFVEIPLDALPRSQAELLARATLERLTRAAACDERVKNVVDESGGVPFFVEELARYFASRPAEATATASLGAAIAARLAELPSDQRAIVEVVAVAGAPVAQAIVFEAAGLDAAALPGLLALRSASFLVWTGAGAGDLVSTYHDRIREAVLESLGPARRLERHLALARAFARRCEEGASNPRLFDAVRHLSAAEGALADRAERRAAAALHLAAGRAARSAAAFPLAFSCFEGGIAFLAKDAWDADYDLALALHAGAAEAAYLSGEWTRLAARVAEVKAFAKTGMDQLLAWEVEIDWRIGRHEYMAAVDTAVEALALFGVKLPRDPDRAELGAAFERALASLRAIGPEGFAALPDVSDPEVAAAMRIQVRVAPAAYFGKPALLPILASNLVRTSIERGLSTATPYALALFGIVLNVAGMYPVAHAWGELAVRLLDRWDDRSLEAATRHVAFNLVCPWMVPLRSILEPLREVFDIGKRTGDFEYAAYAAHGYVHNAMYAGRPLGPLVVEALELGAEMRALGQLNAHHVHEPFEQLLRAWTGGARDPSTLDDGAFDERALLARFEAEGSWSGIFVLRLAMGLARYHFGGAKDASGCFEIAKRHLEAASSVWHVPVLHQFAALAACKAWPELDAAERDALRPSIDASLAALRTLAGHAPVNFAHRVNLVEGELRRIEGDDSGARAHFAKAIEEAREADFVPDIALAYELVARSAPDVESARAALATARDVYAGWGAIAKAQRLAAELEPGSGGL